jgi:hypothetical protein
MSPARQPDHRARRPPNRSVAIRRVTHPATASMTAADRHGVQLTENSPSVFTSAKPIRSQKNPVAIRRDHPGWTTSGHATDRHGPNPARTTRDTHLTKQVTRQSHVPATSLPWSTPSAAPTQPRTSPRTVASQRPRHRGQLPAPHSPSHARPPAQSPPSDPATVANSRRRIRTSERSSSAVRGSDLAAVVISAPDMGVRFSRNVP